MWQEFVCKYTKLTDVTYVLPGKYLQYRVTKDFVVLDGFV